MRGGVRRSTYVCTQRCEKKWECYFFEKKSPSVSFCFLQARARAAMGTSRGTIILIAAATPGATAAIDETSLRHNSTTDRNNNSSKRDENYHSELDSVLVLLGYCCSIIPEELLCCFPLLFHRSSSSNQSSSAVTPTDTVEVRLIPQHSPKTHFLRVANNPLHAQTEIAAITAASSSKE